MAQMDDYITNVIHYKQGIRWVTYTMVSYIKSVTCYKGDSQGITVYMTNCLRYNIGRDCVIVFYVELVTMRSDIG